MVTIDAIYSGGVFKPLGTVAISDNQLVKITVKSINPAPDDSIVTATDVLHSPIAGLWSDRTEIVDSQAFARELREQAQAPRPRG